MLALLLLVALLPAALTIDRPTAEAKTPASTDTTLAAGGPVSVPV